MYGPEGLYAVSGPYFFLLRRGVCRRGVPSPAPLREVLAFRWAAVAFRKASVFAETAPLEADLASRGAILA